MRRLQLSVLENQATKLEAMTTATRKRRRVSFAPEPPTTHDSDDVVITEVVEGSKDLKPLPRALSERGGEQSTGAESPDLTGALFLQGVSDGLDMESTEGDVGSKTQDGIKSPPGTRPESPVETPFFSDVATPCVSSCHQQKHSVSPPDHVERQVNPPIHLPEMQGHSRDLLSDEESLASSVSSATSDVIMGKKRRGRPRRVKNTGEIAVREATVQGEQKQQEAEEEVVGKEGEGLPLRTRKRRRRKTSRRKTVAVVTAVTEEVEEGERDRESATGEGLGVGESKKRRLAQEEESQPSPETARGESQVKVLSLPSSHSETSLEVNKCLAEDAVSLACHFLPFVLSDTNHLLYQLLDEQTTPIVEMTQVSTFNHNLIPKRPGNKANSTPTTV